MIGWVLAWVVYGWVWYECVCQWVNGREFHKSSKDRVATNLVILVG